MYQGAEYGSGQGGGTAFLTMDRALPAPAFGRAGTRSVATPQSGGRFADLDLVVDLGARIGSRDWWRGLATLAGLLIAAYLLAPGFRPLVVPSTPFTAAEWDEARALAITPAAFGSDSGLRMAPTDAVEPLAETPERPTVELTATLGLGDGFARVLERAGVAHAEAVAVADKVSGVMPLDDIRAGTRIDVVLGRRPAKDADRPLEHLLFRARLDLRIALERAGAGLRLVRMPIAIDDTPLRVQGRVGSSLYLAARGSGAPAAAVAAYLRAIGTRVSLGQDVGSGDRFDLVIAQRRAATGEVEMGDLLYAGLDQGRRQVRLLRWEQSGRLQWFEASGVGETRGVMRMPVYGHLTSNFGMRFHPLLGFSRMHKGVDFGAAYGSPIVAATDGVVAFAGWHGGHGNFVKLNHAGGIATGYGHMSRIAVAVGTRVQAGQVIGYVGSTGLSTGPHLHYELYRGGQAVNPLSVKFTTTAQLAGEELRRFRARLAALMAVNAGGAAKPLLTAGKDPHKVAPAPAQPRG